MDCGNEIFNRLLHELNTFFPIETTLSGIFNSLTFEQFWKALSPMVSTLLPNIIEETPLHKMYLQPIITQYFIDNKSEIWLLFLIAHSKR